MVLLILVTRSCCPCPQKPRTRSGPSMLPQSPGPRQSLELLLIPVVCHVFPWKARSGGFSTSLWPDQNLIFTPDLLFPQLAHQLPPVQTKTMGLILTPSLSLSSPHPTNQQVPAALPRAHPSLSPSGSSVPAQTQPSPQWPRASAGAPNSGASPPPLPGLSHHCPKGSFLRKSDQVRPGLTLCLT